MCSRSLSISRGDAFPNSANSIFLAQVRATQVLSQILNSILKMQKIAFVKNYFSNLLKQARVENLSNSEAIQYFWF